MKTNARRHAIRKRTLQLDGVSDRSTDISGQIYRLDAVRQGLLSVVERGSIEKNSHGPEEADADVDGEKNTVDDPGHVLPVILRLRSTTTSATVLL